MTFDQTYSIHILITLDDAGDVPEERLRETVSWILMREAVAPGAEVSIVIAGDEEVRALNRQFRGVDGPTDVLSFPAESDPIPEDIILEEEENIDYLGDLVISLPYIQRQAASEGHRIDDEVLLAVIHGTLHLLGYDHDTAENEDEMWRVQAEALAAFDVAINVPRFVFPDDDSAPMT